MFVALKLYGVNATIIIFVFVLYCIVFCVVVDVVVSNVVLVLLMRFIFVERLRARLF